MLGKEKMGSGRSIHKVFWMQGHFLVSTKTNKYIKVLNNKVIFSALGHTTMNYLEGGG